MQWKHRLGIAVVVALVVLNIFLIPRALQQGRGDEPAATPTTDGQPTLEPTGADTDEDPGEPSASEAPGASAVVLEDGPTLMATRGDVVVHAERGDCTDEEPAGVVLSTDGGRTFAPVRLDEPLAAVTALDVSEESIEVVGADAACDPAAVRSTDGGETWDVVEAADGWRVLAQRGEEQVLSPDGALETPCTPLALSSVGDAVVRVLCDSGRLLGEDGSEWVALGTLEGATAIRYPTPAVGFAIAPGEDCPVAVLRTEDGGADWTELACVDGVEAPGAVAGQDGRYVARAGDTTLVSTDGGETWATP